MPSKISDNCPGVSYVVGCGFARMAAMECDRRPDGQYYHGTGHLSYGIPATVEIAEALELPSREVSLARAAFAVHDWVQDHDPAGVMSPDKRMVLQRKRRRGHNENNSAQVFEMVVRYANSLFGKTIFTPEEVWLGKVAIQWTYPEYAPGVSTFCHPHLRNYHAIFQELPGVCAAVVWADLADVGQDPVHAAQFARLEYLELAMGIWDELGSLQKQSDLPKERQEQLRGHALDFFEKQEKFITGRQRFMDEEIGFLPSHKRDAVVALFPAWEESKAYARDQYARLSKLGVFELLWTLGFTPIPRD